MIPAWSKDAAINRAYAIIDGVREEIQRQGACGMSVTTAYWNSEKEKFIPVTVKQEFQKESNPYGEQNHPLNIGE